MSSSYLKLKFWWRDMAMHVPVFLLTLVFSLCSSPQRSSFRIPSCELKGSSPCECVCVCWVRGQSSGKEIERENMRGKPYATCRATQHYSVNPLLLHCPRYETQHTDERQTVVPHHWLNRTCVSLLSWESSERSSLFPGLNVTFWSCHVGTVMCSAL